MHMHALDRETCPSNPYASRADLSSADTHPEIQAKLAELQSRTIEYNRELIRITGELSEIRQRLSHSRPSFS